MRNPLNKRLKRDLTSNAGRYIAVAVMLIASIGMLSGFLATADAIKTAFYDNRLKCKVEDGLFTSYLKVPKTAINKAEKLGTNIYENYYLDEAVLKDATLRVYKDRKDINIPTIMEGKLPLDKHSIAIDRLFAKNNSLKVGDSIKIKGHNYKITGTVALPDYSALFEKNSNLMMETKYFGVAIVSNEAFKSFNDSKITYNYSYYFKNRNLNDKKSKDLSDSIKKSLLKNGTALTDFCTSKNNQSISFVEDDMGSDVPMMKVFCYIIIAIMAFVFAIIIMSTIDEEAPIIGTLLSNGYNRREILSHYIKLPIIITVISAVIGNVVGYAVLPSTFKSMYYNSYSLPPCTITLNFEALILTTILPILIMIIINIAVISIKLNISPLRFLRRDLRRHSHNKPIKLPNFKFVSRFCLRVILQNKFNYFILFIGIFLGGLILLFGLSMKPMIDHYVKEIKQSTISDYQYVLKAPVNISRNDAEKFTMYSLKTYYKAGNRNLEASFYGIENKSKYVSLNTNKDGIYMASGLMKKLGCKNGETVKFSDPYTNNKYSLKIIGSYNYSAGFAVFMDREQLNKMLKYKKSYYNGYFSNKKLNIDDKLTATIITPKDMIKLGQQMTSSLGNMAYMCLAVAVLIYMSLMYVLTKIVIDKNALYISYMKVFGYEENEIRNLYLNSTTVVVVASLFIGLPLNYLALKYCFSVAFTKVNGYMETYVPAYLFAIIVGVGIVSYLVINYLHMRRVNKISIADALKNRD